MTSDLRALTLAEMLALLEADPALVEPIRAELSRRPCLDRDWRPGDPMPAPHLPDVKDGQQ